MIKTDIFNHCMWTTGGITVKHFSNNYFPSYRYTMWTINCHVLSKFVISIMQLYIFTHCTVFLIYYEINIIDVTFKSCVKTIPYFNTINHLICTLHFTFWCVLRYKLVAHPLTHHGTRSRWSNKCPRQRDPFLPACLRLLPAACVQFHPAGLRCTRQPASQDLHQAG